MPENSNENDKNQDKELGIYWNTKILIIYSNQIVPIEQITEITLLKKHIKVGNFNEK